MTDLTRLKIVASCDWKGFAYAHTETDVDGDYVTFEEAVAALAVKDADVAKLRERGQAFANQVRHITYLLNGQAYSSTVSELNAFDIALNGGSDAP